MSLVIGICSHERPDDLARCLASIAALPAPPPVIVVDSASSPSLEAVVAPFAARLPELVYHYESRPGLSIARNAVLERSDHELVAFLDDDTEVTEGWLEAIQAPFGRLRVAAVGGTARAAFPSPPPPWLSSRLLQYSGITRFPDVAPRAVRNRTEYPVGANLCVRREAVRAAGGFPEHLGRVGRSLLSGEETVVLDRLRACGHEIWIAPQAVVDHRVHPERLTSRYYWRRLWWQGITRARGSQARGVGLRVSLTAPARAGAYVLTGDRFYLYRLAEAAGYWTERLRRNRPTGTA